MRQKNKKNLCLGTRQSLLAMAQSRAVAQLIEQESPGVTVQLTGIETRGDRELEHLTPSRGRLVTHRT